MNKLKEKPHMDKDGGMRAKNWDETKMSCTIVEGCIIYIRTQDYKY